MRRNRNGDSSFWDDPDEDPSTSLTTSARQSNGTAPDNRAERNSAVTNGTSAAGDRLPGASSSQQVGCVWTREYAATKINVLPMIY